jgi:hypothetical protein
VHAATPLPKGLEASETAEGSSIKRPVEETVTLPSSDATVAALNEVVEETAKIALPDVHTTAFLRASPAHDESSTLELAAHLDEPVAGPVAALCADTAQVPATSLSENVVDKSRAGSLGDDGNIAVSMAPTTRVEASPAPVDVAVDGAPLESVTAPATKVDASPTPSTNVGVTVEVGPLEIVATPVPDTPLNLAPRVWPDNTNVYRRRRDEPATLASEFISAITKQVEAVVPVPNIPKRRTKTAGQVSMPRRSRRIANLPPETYFPSTSMVCRKLGLADEDGKISDEALNRYANFYDHLLGRDHVAALSALFGWEIPTEGEARVAAGSVTVL